MKPEGPSPEVTPSVDPAAVMGRGMPVPVTLHMSGGLGFTRVDGGGVIIHLPGASIEAEAGEASVTLDADTWAGIVAAMKPEYAPREDDHPALAAGRTENIR